MDWYHISPRTIIYAIILIAIAQKLAAHEAGSSRVANTSVIEPLPGIINTTATSKADSETPIINSRAHHVIEHKRTKKICPGVHIRNDLKSFEVLRGCTIIDGPLTIALVSNQSHPYEPTDYENITFPELTEITEYLLFFRVQGLTHLSTLFPNLAVIRGRELFANYALIIYEMMHLQRVALPSLQDILRGSVRIENNPNLCYVSTVNWEVICKHGYVPHFIKDNNLRCNNNNRCPEDCLSTNSPLMRSSPDSLNSSARFIGDNGEPSYEYNRTSYCWSNQLCQDFCPHKHDDGKTPPMSPDNQCCSHMCAGGCYTKDDPSQCIACRYVMQRNVCVEYCDTDLFEFKGECISQEACEKVILNAAQQQCDTNAPVTSNFKALHLPEDKYGGRCRVDCPPGMEEDATNRHRCKPCDKGKCRRVCTSQDSDKPFMVTNVNSLRELTGCNVINGSLEISMKGGKNVLNELVSVFHELEEIMGYLKITRSYPITTLDFLRNLKYINGSEQDRGLYSLILIDNPNLEELFLFNSTNSNRGMKMLRILGGTVFAHLNPKLCPSKINALKTYAEVKSWDEEDVSIHTNGDKQACNTIKLLVEFVQSSARYTRIKFANYAASMDDPRSLLYYLINYRELPNGTTTMFDGRDGCSGQNDVWLTIEEAPIKLNNKPEPFQEALIPVKPATRYALYIKTYTISSGSIGALSDMIYFETAPDTPGIPRQIESEALTNYSVAVYWQPPSKPNGNIEYYLFNVTKVVEFEDFASIDVCNSIESREKITEKITDEEPKISSFSARVNSATPSMPEATQVSCPKDISKLDSDAISDTEDKVSFQDLIIDIVYLKQPCLKSNAGKNVKKRSIGFDPSARESTSSQNSLPRKPHLTNHIQFDGRTERISNHSVDHKPESLAQKDRQLSIHFNSNITRTEARIFAKDLARHASADGYKYKIDIHGLQHSTMYTIEVVACHGEYIGNKAKLSKSYNKCGLQAITQIRTLTVPEFDRIPPQTISFYQANETFQENLIVWKPPEKPNGLVLAYRIRYKLKISEHWTEVCLNNTAYNRDGGLIIQDVLPGTYLFSVRAVTMYSRVAVWSDEMEFEIQQDYIISPTVLSILIIIVLGCFGLAVASGTYYYQKRKHELIYASVNPDYIQYEPDEWEVDKSNVIIGSQVGTGAFGQVFKGQLKTEKGTISCALKTTYPTSTAQQRTDFLREASTMKAFDTYHVVKLLGVVSISTPIYVIMEYMENGDLKDFLRAQRDIHESENKTLVDGIYLMVAQIADGMAYLASKKFVHRDLAARNCMVGENRVVKIGDFGLTREIYANDYYRRGNQGRLPVRWMAPETLNDNMCTTSSDVWSFGVVIWEIVTFSAHPYQGLSNQEVCKKIVAGHTMSRPQNCPDKLYTIMSRCWRYTAKERPSFEDIIEYILPETEGKLLPNCFYKKSTADHAGDSIAHSLPEESNTGTESYPLLSWPTPRANGLTNGENHVIRDDSPDIGVTLDD